jgi:hypothetical protein
MYVNLIEETGWSDKIEIDSCIESAMSLLDSQRFLDIFQKPGNRLLFKYL